MIRLLLASAICAIAIVCLLQTVPAQAYSININSLTCHDLLSLDDESIGAVVVWIDGYYTAKTGSTEFDPDSWEDLGEMIGTLCAENPDRQVIQAIDDVLRAMQGY